MISGGDFLTSQGGGTQFTRIPQRTRVDGIARVDVDNFSQRSVRDPPMTFRIINGDRGGFRVEPDDDADSGAQMFVGEANGVANEEFLSLCSR